MSLFQTLQFKEGIFLLSWTFLVTASSPPHTGTHYTRRGVCGEREGGGMENALPPLLMATHQFGCSDQGLLLPLSSFLFLE